MASEQAQRVMDMMNDDPRNFNPIHGIATAPTLSFKEATDCIDTSCFEHPSLVSTQVVCAEMFAEGFDDDDVLTKDQIRFFFFFIFFFFF